MNDERTFVVSIEENVRQTHDERLMARAGIQNAGRSHRTAGCDDTVIAGRHSVRSGSGTFPRKLQRHAARGRRSLRNVHERSEEKRCERRTRRGRYDRVQTERDKLGNGHVDRSRRTTITAFARRRRSRHAFCAHSARNVFRYYR